MANLSESATWEAGIYQIETTDPVIGGASGISNTQGKQLANRTAYLKQHVDTLETNVTELQTSGPGGTRGRGLPRHCVVVAKAGYMNSSTINLSNGTVQIEASADDPFVATISGGFGASGNILRYVKFEINKTASYTTSGDKWILVNINTTTNVGTLALDTKAAYTLSYLEPTSPTNGDYWYSLGREILYKRETGAWVAKDGIIIGYTDNANNRVVYVGKVGVGPNELFGRSAVPAGTVHTFAGAIAGLPSGYLLADGSAISRTIYADLYAAIGTTYGVGNGSTTFNIPDLRGEFIRGLDNARGIDTGRALGSAQADELKSHDHVERYANSGGAVDGVATITNRNAASMSNFGFSTGSTGGTETRPRNIAMNFVIKF